MFLTHIETQGSKDLNISFIVVLAAVAAIFIGFRWRRAKGSVSFLRCLIEWILIVIVMYGAIYLANFVTDKLGS